METASSPPNVEEFWETVRPDVCRYVSRVISRMGCPPEFARGSPTAGGVKVPGWNPIRAALSTDRDLLEDILGDTRWAIVSAAMSGRFPDDPTGRRRWTWAVARRIAWRAAPTRARMFGVPLWIDEGEGGAPGEWLAADGPSPEEAAIRRKDMGPLLARLEALKESDRALLEGVIMEGRMLREIADELNVPAGTIRCRLSRVLSEIRAMPEVRRLREEVEAA